MSLLVMDTVRPTIGQGDSLTAAIGSRHRRHASKAGRFDQPLVWTGRTWVLCRSGQVQRLAAAIPETARTNPILFGTATVVAHHHDESHPAGRCAAGAHRTP